MSDKEFLNKYEELLNKDYCNCNEMNCIDNNSPRRILNIAKSQQDEIERLNNIINELEEILEYEKNDYGGNIDIETHNIDSEFLRGNSWEADYILNKLQELKGSDK